MLGNFSGVNSKGLYLRSEKEKEKCCLFTSSIKCETRRFHVVVIQKRVKHEQSCWFANLNLLLFFAVFVASSSSLLKLPNYCKVNDVSGQQNTFTRDIIRVLVLILNLIKSRTEIKAN